MSGFIVFICAYESASLSSRTIDLVIHVLLIFFRLLLFLLKEKVTKKFKDNPIAPRVCPASATRLLC